jgi:AcrR family transcriptional regulator
MDLDSYELMNGELTEIDQEKRERVFNAAKELFGRFGFRKTTVDEIADRAGLSKRTMYQVFRSKEQILAELVMFEALTFRRYLLEKIKHLDDPVRKFRTFCNLSAHYFDENPFLGRVLADDSGLFSPFLDNELHLVEDGIRGIIGRLLAEGIQKGMFQEMNVPATIQCVMVMFRGFTYQRAEWRDGNTEWVSFTLRAIMVGEP